MNAITHYDAAPGLGRRVLLVDDDPVQLKLVRLQLELAGFRVDEARGASAAQRVLQVGDLPAAIVSDVVMGETDGFTFCHTIRRDARLAATPIVLISSAFDEAEDVHLAKSLGANALVRRSDNQQACVEALVRALADGARRRSSSEMPALFRDRVVHQLSRLNGKKAAVEARLGMLYENAIDAISVLTPEGIVLDVNRRWEEITGLSREELRGRSLDFLSPPGHSGANQANYAQLVGEGSGGRSGAVPIRCADGGTIFLEFTTSTAEIDGERTVLAVGRDVTALVEAQQKLEASERHYRSLVENVPDVLWTATRDWQCTYFSPNISKLSGYTAEEFLAGTHGATLSRVHPDDVERVRAAREATERTGAPFDVECRWQHRDGRWIWLHFRGVVTATGIDGMLLDVTARKALEEQLCRAQKVEAVGQLTAGVAHDFNNILAVMAMNTDFLLESLEVGSETWAAAKDLSEAARRGAQVTKQLLAFSRRSASAPKRVDVNELLRGIERMVAQAVGSAVRLCIVPAPDLGLVHADPGQLEQVVMNLAVNARDAMRGRGRLRIETANVVRNGAEECRWGRVTAGHYVRLSVTDDGCGMDAATVEKVFEPFFTTKPEGSGTGLGLSTCYGIARHAGGTIEVDTMPGRGTTFHVYLPCIDTKA